MDSRGNGGSQGHRRVQLPYVAGTQGPNINVLGEANQGSNETRNGNFVREQDHLLPIAKVSRIMRSILPSHARITDECKETMQQCVSEFISFITSKATLRCQAEKRKTLTAEDLIWAMGELGLDNYVEPLLMFLNRYRENEDSMFDMAINQLSTVGPEPSFVGHPPCFFPGSGPTFVGHPHHPPRFFPGSMNDASGSDEGSSQVEEEKFDPFSQAKE